MKGKIICPKCKNEFILELAENKKVHDVICPQCKNKFSVEAKSDSKECSWEEYGEPRKTVLSSLKPRTNKPLITVILLVCVIIIGILTAIFSDVFVQTADYAASIIGYKTNIDNTFFILIFIFSIFSILAIFSCLKRKYFGLAVIGSVIPIFSFGFFFISSILSIIAFILIFVSRDEFEDGKKGKIF